MSHRKTKPRQRRGDAVIRRVLDVAMKELARVGLERLSVPTVAEKAGVNKTSIYRRWPTKDALVRAALSDSMEHVRDVPDTGALATDLAALAAVVARFISSARGTAVLRAVFAGTHSSQLKALSASMWREAGGNLPAQVLGRAVSRGELASDADIELLLFTLAGALMHRVFIERGAVDGPYLARLVELLLGGAAPRRRRAVGTTAA